jgi:hypothetical protein
MLNLYEVRGDDYEFGEGKRPLQPKLGQYNFGKEVPVKQLALL